MKSLRRLCCGLPLPHLAAFVGAVPVLAHATAKADDASDLAAKIQNPIGAVISLPFESNFNFENGTGDDSLQYVLSIQPVLPFGIAENWNLIVRPVMPLISQDEFAQLPNPPIVTKTGDRTFGLGDSTLSFFLAPKEMKSTSSVYPALLEA